MKYIKVTRSDVQGSYIQPVKDIPGIVQGELDDIEYLSPGVSVALTVVEMPEEEYAKLPEFAGW